MSSGPGRLPVATTFLFWTFLRAVSHRGFVLASMLYYVLTAHLSASQLVLLGTVQAVAGTLTDVPAGALSDAISRKWPLVAGHVLLAAGMLMTGLVRAFPLFVVAQLLWALGWACSGGADVAWLTDELAQPERVSRVLTARSRFELTGGATGMICFGLLAVGAGLRVAIVTSAVFMAVLGAGVAAVFSEDNFEPDRQAWHQATWRVLRAGLALARQDPQIRLVLTATLIVNGAGMATWLFPRQLVDIGFPGNAVLWYTGLSVAGSLAGVLVLRLADRHLTGAAVRQVYAVSCLAGAAGLVLLALAPDALAGCAGVILARGVAVNVSMTAGVVWVNGRTTSDVRATVHSLLTQAEYAGEIGGGAGLAAIAAAGGPGRTLIAAAGLWALASLILVAARASYVAAAAVRAAASTRSR